MFIWRLVAYNRPSRANSELTKHALYKDRVPYPTIEACIQAVRQHSRQNGFDVNDNCSIPLILIYDCKETGFRVVRRMQLSNL